MRKKQLAIHFNLKKFNLMHDHSIVRISLRVFYEYYSNTLLNEKKKQPFISTWEKFNLNAINEKQILFPISGRSTNSFKVPIYK